MVRSGREVIGLGALEDVYMELSLVQFYQLLNELQKAKSSLEAFSF